MEAAKVTGLGVITLYIYIAVPWVPQSNKYSEGPSLTSLLCSARDARASMLLLCLQLASVSSIKPHIASSTIRYGEGKEGVRVSRGEPRVRAWRGGTTSPPDRVLFLHKIRHWQKIS